MLIAKTMRIVMRILMITPIAMIPTMIDHEEDIRKILLMHFSVNWGAPYLPS